MAPRYQLLPPYFRLCPTWIWLCRLCPTSADNRNSGWRVSLLYQKRKWWPPYWIMYLANVGQHRQCHRHVRHGRKCGGSGSQAQSVQLLFPFLVSVAAILIFGSRSASGKVGRRLALSTVAYPSRVWPKIWGWVEVEITAPSVTGYFHFRLDGRHLEFR